MSPTPNESFGQKGSLQERIQFTTPTEHSEQVILSAIVPVKGVEEGGGASTENLQEVIQPTTPTEHPEQVILSAIVPVRGEEGGGVSSMSPPPNESFGQQENLQLKHPNLEQRRKQVILSAIVPVRGEEGGETQV